MLFADSDSEGEYLQFGNDDRPSNDRASPGTSLLRNGAAAHGESVHKAHTSDNFGPLPNRDRVPVWLSGRALRQQRKRLWVRFPGNTYTDKKIYNLNAIVSRFG